MNVQNEIEHYVAENKMPIYAITDGENLEHALPGWQPKELIPRAKSILIFGRTMFSLAGRLWFAADRVAAIWRLCAGESL